MTQGVRCRTTTGGACIRNIKAALPNLDRSGSASLYAVLAVGIALAALGGIFMCITVIIIYRWRKVCTTLCTCPESTCQQLSANVCVFGFELLKLHFH